MIRFLARRLTRVLSVFLGVSVLAFILIDLAPGDYIQAMRMNPQIAPQTIAALRSGYGLDQPLPVRYVRWLKSVSRGELGFSLAYNSPVWPLLRLRIGNTLILTITALIGSWLLAIPAGVWMASRAGRWEDRASTFGTGFLLATPDLLVALGLLAFALRTGWLPTGGMHGPAAAEMDMLGRTKDLGFHLVLPVCALALGMLPVLVRHVRSAMLDVLHLPFIAAARGHGVHRYRLLFGHVLPAAANPLISLFGISVGLLLSGSMLTEVIMGWPGVGPMLLQAILERDPHIVIAVVLFSALFLMAGNLLSDIFLYIADPRIRGSEV